MDLVNCLSSLYCSSDIIVTDMMLLALYLVICSYVFYRIITFSHSFYNKCRDLGDLPGFKGMRLDRRYKLEDPPKKYRECNKGFGELRNYRFLWYNYVFTANPEYAEMILTNKKFRAKSNQYKFFKIWIGHGLFSSEGQIWKQHRKLINPAFSAANLNSYVDSFVNRALDLVDMLRGIEKGTPVNVFETMRLVTLDATCESLTGVQINALKSQKFNITHELEEAFHILMKRIREPWLWVDFIFYHMPEGRKLKKYLKHIFQVTNELISIRRDERALKKRGNENTKTDDLKGKANPMLLDLLLNARESDSTPFSEEDLENEMNVFLFGNQTTAAAMSFTLFLLGHHPEIQEKCHQELDSIFQGSDRKLTVNDARSLKYLEQVIKEGLRLFPSIPTLARNVPEDVEIGNVTIPKGTNFIINLYNLHRNPKYFPDPDKFDPDRFSPENCKNLHPFSFLPFSAGARNCMGQKFAKLEEKVILSYILRNFSLESTHEMESIELVFSGITRPKGGLHVRFTPRKANEAPSELREKATI